MSKEIDETSQRLRACLAEAFAPRIDDPDAMRFSAGLARGEAEGALGLVDVPISVVYSAMLNFARAERAAHPPP